MRIDEFRWPAELYPSTGLSVAVLESPQICDQLWEHAVDYAGWPGELNGRIEFHALAIYCLRVGKPPGRLLTSAVRDQRFGRMAWSTSADRIAGARRIGNLSSQTTPCPVTGRRNQEVAKDWTPIDTRLAEMTDDQLFELLPSEFSKALFTRSTLAGKDARQVPTLRAVLRRAVEAAVLV